MKKKEIEKLRQKSLQELEKLVQEWTKELVDLRLKLRSGKLKNVHQSADKRHDIARIKTIIAEKKSKNGKGIS